MSRSDPSKSQLPSKQELKEEIDVAKKSTLSGLRSFVAGGVGGVCAVVVGHPFDLIKVRLQTAEKGVYNGAVDVLRKTIAREGLARVSPTCHVSIRWYGKMLTLPGPLSRGFGAIGGRDTHV